MLHQAAAPGLLASACRLLSQHSSAILRCGPGVASPARGLAAEAAAAGAVFVSASQHGTDLVEFRSSVRDFAKAVVAPHAEEIDRTNNFPTSVNLWKEMGDMGLLGAWVRGRASEVAGWGGGG